MDNKEEIPVVKVSDLIYALYGSYSIIKIKRITKTQIILENDTKLRNEPIKMYGSKPSYYLKAIGDKDNTWNRISYYIEDEDIKAQYKHEQLYLKTKKASESLNLKKLTDEQLNMLLSAMSNIELSIEIKSKLINKENQ